jgi:hypothetical protein
MHANDRTRPSPEQHGTSTGPANAHTRPSVIDTDRPRPVEAWTHARSGNRTTTRRG